MDDRFVRGYTAGAIGGFLMTSLNLIFFSLGITESRHIDLAAMIFLGYVPETLGEMAVSLIIQVGHAALLGFAFSYLVPKIGTKYLLFKGATYGAINWFIVFGVGSLYKIPLYDIKSWLTVASHLTTSSLWGLFMARALVWLGEQVDTEEQPVIQSQILAVPAFKLIEEAEPECCECKARKHPVRRGFWARLKFW